jgi:hypothetical protein
MKLLIVNCALTYTLVFKLVGCWVHLGSYIIQGIDQLTLAARDEENSAISFGM